MSFVTTVDGRSHATLKGPGNPIAALHARTWAVNKPPTDDEIRDAYTAAGFSRAQLERAFKRKEHWKTLPEVAAVRFPRPVGSILQQTELMLAV